MKRSMKLFLLGPCLLAIILGGFITNSSAQSLPIVVPQSPEAASHFKFMDYPVSNSTGVPDISIPLYTVKSGSLTVPVSINYHSSGRKVFDLTGPVGHGWELNAGGMIGRTVFGHPDDLVNFPSIMYPAASLNQQDNSDFLFLDNAARSSYTADTEYDVFSYYFGNQSGKFVIDQNDGDKVMLIPLKPLKVTGTTTRFPDQIIDEYGVKYEFKLDETHSGNIISGKLLTKMTSADGKDIITFIYKPRHIKEGRSEDDYIISDNNLPYLDVGNSSYLTNDANSNVGTLNEYTIQRLAEIQFKDGKVKFNIDTIPSASFANQPDQVASIDIFNAVGQKMKTIILERSVLDNGPDIVQIYKLDALKFIDRGNSVVDKYSFEYNASDGVMANDRDYFGYHNYNGGSHNNRSVPKYTSGSITILSATSGYGPSTGILFGADRTPQTPTSGMLKKITYPTGGTTEFTYESNWFKQGLTTIQAPGLRIYQIKTKDNNGTTKLKTYKYGTAEDGTGYLAGNSLITSERSRMLKMSYENVVLSSISATSTNGRPEYTGYRRRTYTPEVLPDLAEAYNAPVFYNTVTEYDGDPTINIGKTVYTYTSPYHPLETGISVGPAPDHYSLGVTFGVDLSSRYHIYQFDYWQSARLQSVTTYKNTGPSSYEMVKQTSNQYDDVVTNTLTGMHIVSYIPNASSDWADIARQMPVYAYADYSITVAKCELKQTIETVNGLSTVTDYTYNANFLPSEVKVTRSDGTIRKTTMKYPFDDAGDPVHAAMIAKNMLNYVIEQNELVGSTPIKGTKTQYKEWATSVIYPEKLYTKAGSGSYEQRLAYNYSSDGKLISANKVGGTPVSYLYGYQLQYPIVKITNALPTDVFYTSFEETDGNSTAEDAHNGHLSRTGGYSKTVTGLSSGSYTLSYWLKSGSAWTLQKSTITPSSGSYSISLSGQIDDVRLYPVTAQLDTYTFDPLIGVTSVSDARDNTTYYRYDNFDRLSDVKDQYGNIKAHYCYNYAGQLTDCAIPTPVGPQIVYARVEISNIAYNYSGTSSDYYYTTTGDVTIKLYADAACTSPFVTPTAFNAKMKTKWDSIYDYGYGTITGTVDSYHEYAAAVNVSAINIPNVPLMSLHTWTDSYDNPLSSSDTYTLSLVANTGNPYVPETTITIY